MFENSLTRCAQRLAIAVAGTLLATSLATPAFAQSCKAPPGMSAIEQYCESIPSAGGDRGASDSDRGGRQIPPATLRALEQSGPEGQAIVALSAPAQKEAERSAAANAKRSARGTSGKPNASAEAPAARPGQDPIAAVAAGFSQSGETTGPLFGTILLALAVAVFALAWLRYRRRVGT